MKELVILSGKGGTGKTSLAAAFAHLARVGPGRVPLVLADADVDAPNLDLVLEPRRLEEHDFQGGSIAQIDGGRCESCGACAEVCRFDAILEQDGTFEVDSLACEGCGACFHECPAQAIRMQPQVVGRWYRSESRYGPLVHAALFPARENSGKLVAQVKLKARQLMLEGGYAGLLIDGPPGIGCPVISATAGADLALIVTEPTMAGLQDLERILDTTEHFRIPARVCLNKADLFPEGGEPIVAACRRRGVEIAGLIPFDEAVTRAMARGEPVTAFDPAAASSRAIAEVWGHLAADFTESSSELVGEGIDRRNGHEGNRLR